MALYYIFTIDGDWNEYFSTATSPAERQPRENTLLCLINREIQLSHHAGGKLLHFVHFSQTTPRFFLQTEFLNLWKQIQAMGGSVGIHYHHESYTPEGMSDPEGLFESTLQFAAETLRKDGLNVISYRGGYLAFNSHHIPLLKKNKLRLDFSCEPGRHLFHDGKLASDWRNAPDHSYPMSSEDHRKTGTSGITEIPVGKTGKGTLYLDGTPLLKVWKAARELSHRAHGSNQTIVVSILTHTYEFSSLAKRIKIWLAILICRRYGVFINDREAAEITGESGR